MNWTNFAGDKSAGADSSMWVWSGDTAPRTIATSLLSQICRIKSRVRSATRPVSTLYRYFVIHTTWYFRSKTAWALRRYSAISPFCSTVAKSSPPERRGDYTRRIELNSFADCLKVVDTRRSAHRATAPRKQLPSSTVSLWQTEFARSPS